MYSRRTLQDLAGSPWPPAEGYGGWMSSSAKRMGTEVEAVLERLLRWLESHGLESYDYADILQSPMIRALTLQNQLAERVAIQFGKRFPFNVRPLLRIAPHLSSQTLALLCSARAWQYAAGWTGASESTVRTAAEQLIQDRLPDLRNALWGMKLHFRARFFRATPATPNLFQTSNAVHALLDAYQVTEESAFADVADDAIAGCVQEMGFVRLEEGCYCRYYPGAEAATYNVNALLAAACWRLSGLGIGNAELHASRARNLLTFVLDGQRPDGAWPYAAHPAAQWVDGYHSGYVLEALGYFLSSSLEETVRRPLEAGLAYFIRTLIDPDGCPRALDTSRYPIDVQNCAQAIQTLARLIPEAGTSQRFERTLECVIRQLFLPIEGGCGYFVARRNRFFVNKTPYVRWGQAPMVLALTHAWNATRGGQGYFGAEHAVAGLDRGAAPTHASGERLEAEDGGGREDGGGESSARADTNNLRPDSQA
jgi:hypothetical protein